MSVLPPDIVAKRFFASRRAILIQAARPLDSKVAHLEGAADFCYKTDLGAARPLRGKKRVSARLRPEGSGRYDFGGM